MIVLIGEILFINLTCLTLAETKLKLNMKLKHLAIASMFAFAIISCKQSEGSVKSYTEEDMKENPLVQQSSLPYFAPEFDKIKIEHFKPALEYGLQLQSEAIEQIANNPEEPTFENTLVALEKS